MNVKELRDKTPVELEEQLKKLKEELFNLRFQHAINQLENPKRIKAVKKDIARISTIIKENAMKNAQYEEAYKGFEEAHGGDKITVNLDNIYKIPTT